jgi:hypothetical protein
MSKGEKSVFVLPADQLAAPAASSSTQQAGQGQQSSSGQSQHEALIPQPPAKAVQVELSIQLHDLVQVGATRISRACQLLQSFCRLGQCCTHK